jgi:hypothetical protein
MYSKKVNKMSKKPLFNFADWLLKGKNFATNDWRDPREWVEAIGVLKYLGVKELLVTDSSAEENGSENIDDYDHADTLIIVMPEHPSIGLIAYIASLRADDAYVSNEHAIVLWWD